MQEIANNMQVSCLYRRTQKVVFALILGIWMSGLFSGHQVVAAPVTVTAANPEATVTLQATPPSNATEAQLHLTVYDAENSDEGDLFVNGNGPIELFGAQARSAYNEETVMLTFTMPAQWWQRGSNVLEFFHRGRWWGYRIDAVSVAFATRDEAAATRDEAAATRDEAADVVLHPGDNVGAIVKAHPAGTTFQFSAGTYRLADIEPKDDQTFIATAGTIFDGANVTSHAFHSAADNVTIRGFIVENYTSPDSGAIAQHIGSSRSMGTNWVIEDNEVRLNHGAGVVVFDGALVRRNFIHHNGGSGIIGGSQGVGILIESNELAYNNTANFQWAGGVALNRATDLVVRDNFSHHNHGYGLWCDVDCVNTVFEDNVVEDNDDRGLQLELSFTGIIRNNEVRRNGATTWIGAGIMVAESRDIEVHNNLLEDNADGIVVRTDNRGMSQKLGLAHDTENNDVHDNTVIFTNPIGTIHGLYQEVNDTSYYCCRNIQFRNNTYHVPPNALMFRWNKQWGSDIINMTLSEWQALGLQ